MFPTRHQMAYGCHSLNLVQFPPCCTAKAVGDGGGFFIRVGHGKNFARLATGKPTGNSIAFN